MFFWKFLVFMISELYYKFSHYGTNDFLRKKMLNPQITLEVYFGTFLLFTFDVNCNHKNDSF